MTNCESPLLLGAVFVIIIVLPLGTVLTGFAWLGWKERRWAFLTSALLSVVGFVVTLALLAVHDPSLAWAAAPFLTNIVASTMAYVRPTRTARLVALAAAPLPAMAFLVFIAGELAATAPC
jgi:hypothetical protein